MDTAEPDNAPDVERLRFIFGDDVRLDEWVEADEDQRSALVAKRFGDLEDAQLAVRVATVSQILEGQPPQMWPTVQRLSGEGMDVESIVNQIAMVLAQSMTDMVEQLRQGAGEGDDPDDDGSASSGVIEDLEGDDGPAGTAPEEAVSEDRRREIRASFEEVMTSRLERLPVPEPQEVEDALLDVASERGLVDADELRSAALARLGPWQGDTLVDGLAGSALDSLFDEPMSPLLALPGTRVAHADRLRDGAVLTHVLTGSERDLQTLVVSFDLAAFGRIAEPTVDGDAVELVSAEPGHLAWRGPEGWLDGIAAGTCLAVRAGADGAVTIETLPEVPPVEAGAVEALRRVYHEAADEPELPVSGEELVFGLLAEDATALREPRAPLRALCEAAGLEQRGSDVAHDPALWANARWIHRARRVYSATNGDDEAAAEVLRVLGLVDTHAEGDQPDPGDVRDALDALANVEVLALVSDELLDDPDGTAGAAVLTGAAVQEAADGLLHAARRHGRAPAHYLAALGGEIDHDLATAERHLERAVEADPNHVLALDRLAWYASDRGDAARAQRLWERCPRTETITADLATVGSFAAPARAEPGRNDRCWCGSGRKYKQCHLGVVESPALAERVRWLWRKAVDFLDRGSTAARHTMVDVIAARVPDAEDQDEIERAVHDPLVADLVLTEGGWFDRFLEDRSTLLPADEGELAASWHGVGRAVYEVPGSGRGSEAPGTVTLRDVRTGEDVAVREPRSTARLRPGVRVCARAVPDGRDHQLVGAVFPVEEDAVPELLELLDEGDPRRIARWAADR